MHRKNNKRNIFQAINYNVNTPSKRFKGDGWVSTLTAWIMPFIILLITNANIISFMDPLIPAAITIFSIIYTPTAFFDAQRSLSLARFSIDEQFRLTPNSTFTSFISSITGYIYSLNPSTQSGYRTMFPRLLRRLNVSVRMDKLLLTIQEKP
eukprot:60243_1